MKDRRTALHVVLMLLLLFSQQTGMSHAVTHFLHSAAYSADSPSGSAITAGIATRHESTLPGDMQCIKCLAFASIGSGLVDAAPPRFADPESGRHHVEGAVAARLPFLIRAFDSRAPPVSC